MGYVLAVLLRLRRTLWRARRADRRRFVALSLMADAIEVAAAALTSLFALGLVLIGAPIAGAILLALAAALVVPHWLIELVAVPRGWHRLAHALGRVDPRGDGAAWASLVAARALARRGAPDDGVAWLTARHPGRLDGAAVVTHALIAHGRGDRDGARRLMRSLHDLREPGVAAEDVASEWLAVDAAERGAWAELIDGASRWPASPLRFLLEGVALRAGGVPTAPGRGALWLRWLVAPARRATWALVRAPIGAPTATSIGIDPGPPDADPRAAAATALAQARLARSPSTAAAAVAAWATVLDDPAWLPGQLARAAALGLDPTSALATVNAARDALIGALVELVVTTHAPLPGEQPGVAAVVRARARGRILDGVEVTFDRLTARIEARQPLPAIDEWREFLAVRDGYLAAVAPGGIELERVAFPHVDTALGAWVVWLWNQRGEHHLSHAITCWLYERARVVGDTAAVEHHGRNRALTIPR